MLLNLQLSGVNWNVPRNFDKSAGRAINCRSFTMAGSRAFCVYTAFASISCAIFFDACKEILIHLCSELRPRWRLTFKLFFAKSLNSTAMHSFWRITAGPTRFDGVFMQIIGKPSQIAVTNERISCQVSIGNQPSEFKKCLTFRFTYSVWMLFIASKVPLANDWMLLSYSDNRLRLCRSLNESLRMHEISLAFNSNSCSEVSPRKTLAGRSLILFPYNTLDKKKTFLVQETRDSGRNLNLTKLSATSVRWRHHERPEICCY